MKFIGGIHTFQLMPDGITVKIPSYHRSSTGLFPKTTVYLYPRKTNEGRVREIVVSPFHPMNWAYIWKLELNSIDRPGLIKDITKVLRDERVNIFIQESLITNYNEDFTVSLIAHFHDYFEKQDVKINRKLDPEELVGIHERVRAIFDNVNEGSQETNKIEVERFEQIKFLINNSKDVIMNRGAAVPKSKANIVDEQRLNHYYQAGYHGTKIENKGVKIENRLLVDLSLHEYADDSNNIQGTLFSDTEEKFIIVRFFSKDQLVVNLEITHENLFGAINAFTKKINQIDKDYNIISCYNRIEDDQNTAIWYVLVDVTSNPDRVQTLIEELRNIHQPQVKQVRAISYSSSLVAETLRRNLALEESDEQRELHSKKVSSDEKELEFRRELLKVNRSELETLNTGRRLIQIRADREMVYKLLSATFLIFISLGAVVALVLMIKWQYLEPWVSIIPFVVAGLTSIYSIITGFHLQFPRNDDTTKKRILNKWISRFGYEFEGENSLENRIALLKGEIEKYKENIRELEIKLLK